MIARIKKGAYLALLCSVMVGVAPAPADAKKPSTRARVHNLERQVKALSARLADTESTAETAMSATALLYSCIGAVPVNPFVLAGSDPVLDQIALVFSQDSTVDPAYWVAIIDGSCLAAPTQAPRMFGPRARGLRGVR